MIAAWSKATSCARSWAGFPPAWPSSRSISTGQRLGLTVASLVSLSLSPPLIGVAIRRDAALHELMHEAGGFAVSMLAEGQEHLAQHFARGVPPIALWEGIPLRDAEGPPQLDGALGVAALPARRRARDRRPHVLHRRGRERRARPRRAAARLPRAELPRPVIEAVVFDLDGVLLDSEQVWDEAREQLANERGGRWHENAQRDMMGMSSPEWSRYMHDDDRVAGAAGGDQPARSSSACAKLYREHLPRAPGRARGGRAARRAVAARPRLVIEPRADRSRPRADGRRAPLQRPRSRQRRCPRQAGARRLPRGGAAPRRRPDSRRARSRTPRTASARRRRPGCAWSRSRTSISRRPRRRSAQADVVLESLGGAHRPKRSSPLGPGRSARRRCGRRGPWRSRGRRPLPPCAIRSGRSRDRTRDRDSR